MSQLEHELQAAMFSKILEAKKKKKNVQRVFVLNLVEISLKEFHVLIYFKISETKVYYDSELVGYFRINILSTHAREHFRLR